MCGGGRGSYRDLVERQNTVPPYSTQMQRGLTKDRNWAFAVRNDYYQLEPWHGGSKVPLSRVDAGRRSLDSTITTTHGLYPSLIPGWFVCEFLQKRFLLNGFLIRLKNKVTAPTIISPVILSSFLYPNRPM
jgi:hypothetical protein